MTLHCSLRPTSWQWSSVPSSRVAKQSFVTPSTDQSCRAPLRRTVSHNGPQRNTHMCSRSFEPFLHKPHNWPRSTPRVRGTCSALQTNTLNTFRLAKKKYPDQERRCHTWIPRLYEVYLTTTPKYTFTNKCVIFFFILTII